MDKVPINGFFNADDRDQEFAEPNNIETLLRNYELPFLGSEEQVTTTFKSFENIFNMREEVEIKVITDANIAKKRFENEASEEDIIESDANQLEIEHNFINF